MASRSKGQTLVEVVVAIGAMSILLVALLALVSLTLRNGRLARDRARGVSLAQEGVELMRVYRDYNWTQFSQLADGTNYNLPANWVVADGLSSACLHGRQIDNFFWRCVSLSSAGTGQVEVAISVGWPEGSQTFITNQVTQLTLWER